MRFEHTSVLLEEVLDNLAIKPDGIYVDGTLGGGGHSFHILERLTAGGRLIGIDQDTDAIAAAGERLAQFGDSVTIVHDNYEHIAEVLEDLSISGVDGILLDLGVSSYQLDNPERGFTYRTDAPLDMRMDQSSSLTAREIVNTYSQEELTRILREYGEERCASRIAANIVRRRQERPLETTGELSEVISTCPQLRIAIGHLGMANPPQTPCWENDSYNIWVQSGDLGVLCYRMSDEVWTLDYDAVRPDYIISRYDSWLLEDGNGHPTSLETNTTNNDTESYETTAVATESIQIPDYSVGMLDVSLSFDELLVTYMDLYGIDSDEKAPIL